MRFYLEYINHLGRLQKKSAQLVSLSNHRRLQAGFTITEVLLAGVMMLIAVLVSGIGVINLLRSNYRANADSEIQNNLNRTLEFVSDDLRRAKTIAQTASLILTDQVPNWETIRADEGARAVLAFQIPDPDRPSRLLPNQIVYYTRNPENSLTGPRVLWRFGPNLDANGNYTTPDNIDTWGNSPVTDMLVAADAVNPNCGEDFQLIAVNPDDVDGFYACVSSDGGQVILNANARVNLTTGNTDKDKVDYAVSTRVSTRATCEIFCLIPPASAGDPPPTTPPPPTPTSPPPTPTSPSFTLPGNSQITTVPVLTVPAMVTAVVIESSCSDCTVGVGSRSRSSPPPKEAMPSTIEGRAGDAVIITVDGLINNTIPEPPNTIQAYTSTSSDSPRPLDSNQILLVFNSSYQVLVTITPK